MKRLDKSAAEEKLMNILAQELSDEFNNEFNKEIIRTLRIPRKHL